MSAPVITVENIGKEYWTGGREAPPESLRELFASKLAQPLRRFRNLSGRVEPDKRFWALKNVSFEVHEGEVLGIIGRNGAGKSTLLKILSRITAPTNGQVKIRGRVASLLEVGTGFHPELTGRENIYLNGAILGMSRAEINRKFDEIVTFSGVEKFLDTPVKRYSSGMHVRLAFAVAAHLQPEILIIDEVLAVGDAEFQAKCLGKMGDVARCGRTVLFVSHNMVAVRKLCPRALLVASGMIASDGETGYVINEYLSAQVQQVNDSQGEVDLTNYPNRYGSGEIRLTRARLLNHESTPASVLHRLKPAAIEFTIEGKCTRRLHLSAICMTPDGLKLLQLDHHDTRGFDPGLLNGSSKVRVEIGSIPLQCGEYQWAIAVHSEALQPIDVVLDIMPFKVEDDLTCSRRPYRSVAEHGFCSLLANWRSV